MFERSAERSEKFRSRRELSNKPRIAKIGVDTAENKPSQASRKLEVHVAAKGHAKGVSGGCANSSTASSITGCTQLVYSQPFMAGQDLQPAVQPYVLLVKPRTRLAKSAVRSVMYSKLCFTWCPICETMSATHYCTSSCSFENIITMFKYIGKPGGTRPSLSS